MADELIYRTDVNDGQNNPSFSVLIETAHGKVGVIALSICDRDSLETLAKIHVPVMSAMGIGQALMLAASMKQETPDRG